MIIQNISSFLLIRHGEAAWHLPTEKGARGWGFEISPLTKTGIHQVKDILNKVRDWSPDLILCSPTSRTLQTCALLSSKLEIPFEVEFDLHEWIPDLSLKWDSLDKVVAAYNEMERMDGEWPEGKNLNWEPLSKVRQRVSDVLKKYTAQSRLVVICHEIVIKSLTGRKLGLAESIEFQL